MFVVCCEDGLLASFQQPCIPSVSLSLTPHSPLPNQPTPCRQLRAANARVSYTGDAEAGWKGLSFSHAADEATEATAALMDTLLAEPLVAHVSANSLLEIADASGSARRMLKQKRKAPAPAPPPSPSPAPAPAPVTTTCYASTLLSTTTATKTATTTNWGLDRIDSRANDAAARAPGAYQYRYATSGAGVSFCWLAGL